MTDRRPVAPGRLALVLLVAGVACREAGEPRAAATLETTPPWAALLLGDSVRLAVTATDGRGDTIVNPVVSWTSSSPEVATVADGMVHAASLGAATITAQVGDRSAQTTVLVAPPVLVGAGDIGVCDSQGDEQTAALLDAVQGVVFTAGDNAYPDGTAANFTDCYQASWGRHRARTRPTPGNHDYHTTGAAGYYAFFGAQAGAAGLGHYSWDFAGWHLVALNSNIAMAAGSPQEQWLRQDLAAHPASCTLAYWHHPRFSSSEHGSSTAPRPLWQALYDGNADVVIAGHDHTYERFAPQTPDGAADPSRGLRQFVVGTGGADHYVFPSVQPNSEVRDSTTWGVLKLTLRPDGYDWRFVPVAGASFVDSGTASCH